MCIRDRYQRRVRGAPGIVDMSRSYGAPRIGSFAAPRDTTQPQTRDSFMPPPVPRQTTGDFNSFKIPVPSAEASPSQARLLRPVDGAGFPIASGSWTVRDDLPGPLRRPPQISSPATKVHAPPAPLGPYSSRDRSTRFQFTSKLTRPLPGATLSPREVGISGYSGHIPHSRSVFGCGHKDIKTTARRVEKLDPIQCPSHTIPPHVYYQKARGELFTPLKFRRNRSNGHMGDHRLADFSSVSHAAYVDHSALPVAPPMSSEQVRDMYEYAQSRVNHAQVELMEQMLREKINQRTRSGGFALKFLLFGVSDCIQARVCVLRQRRIWRGVGS
eukprot:TRINITY_DN3104_c0_g1_i7.p1 TRINITY_DN3104_c0_g1~~TRINITY_DN3104_c0_g1_i7.p1  ORF type:complete len:329 (+),score=29.48 TRINITY_DN3104_c0_g1_i7:158-1144(+)